MPAETTAMLAHDVTFASLGVPAPLVAVLDGTGITTPFPIQAAALPDALNGRAILGRAKTGRGQAPGLPPPDGRAAGRRPDRGGPAARARARADPGAGEPGAGGPD